VFYEVDEALRALVRAEVLDGTDVDVVFEAPTKEWASRRNAPTVNLYLYDIREDLRRRERGLVNTYAGDRVVARREPPRHFKITYLITAWTQRPEDEHRLLSALLYCFLRHPALPAELLRGPLAATGLPVEVSVALPPPEDRSFADVWSALGGELKPSLDLVVTAPVDGGRLFPAGPPTERPLVVEFGTDDDTHLERREGRPRAAEPPPAPPADRPHPARAARRRGAPAPPQAAP
jgi:hypothetical protein